MTEKGFMNLPLALGMGILGGLRPTRAPQSFFSALGPGLAQGLQMYAANQPKPQSELEKLRIAQIQAQMDASKAAAAQAAKRRAMQEQWIETQPPEAQKLYRAFPDLAAKEFFKSREPAKPGSLKPVFNTATNTHQFATPAQITSNPNLVPPAAAPKAQEPKSDNIQGNAVYAQLANTASNIRRNEKLGKPATGEQKAKLSALITEYTKPRYLFDEQSGKGIPLPRNQLPPEIKSLAQRLFNTSDSADAAQATVGNQPGVVKITEGRKTAKERMTEQRFKDASADLDTAIELLKQGTPTGLVGRAKQAAGGLARDLQQLGPVNELANMITGGEPIQLGKDTALLVQIMKKIELGIAKAFTQDTSLNAQEREKMLKIVGDPATQDPDVLLQQLLVLKQYAAKQGGSDAAPNNKETREEEIARLRREIADYEARNANR